MPLLMPRFGRPGLIGTAARTAVIAGTASATAGAVRRHQYTRDEQSFEQQQLAEAEQQRRVEDAARDAARHAGAPPEPADDAGLVEQLQRLARLHEAHVLDDYHFTAAKAKLLA
ncbi:SHOCT domain-containing protein [Cellulomonas sp. Y8]|uniref:SHOCT domain-containing protein n=1 Tax=Cellulomonas sp. Y8 TaxID=2591145 RepID=UPI0011C73AD5|nr:SHOCT domain-containing protein [Cellulomonas sp. Y8]